MATVATDIQTRSSDGEGEVFAAIKEFLRGSTTLGGGTEISEDTLLLESGILDSLGILQLMTFLSDTMGIEISDEDFVAENFRTVGSLARFVSKKQSSTVS